MGNKEALGKGIRALLENINTEPESKSGELSGNSLVGTVNQINLDEIEVNPFQPRADFDEQKLSELAESIRIHGVIQPITVRKIGQQKYQLIAGERRLRAAKIAELTEIPAYVRNADDQEMLEIGLIENIQRENLNAIEIAINYQRLMDECGLTHEALSERVSKDRTTVTNYLRLLKLPPEIQTGIKSKKISMGHARALIAIPEIENQLTIYKSILKKGLSVRQVEEFVRNLQGVKKKTEPKSDLPQAYKQLQDRLTSHYGTKVNVHPKSSGKGEIVIHYYSDDDLNRILDIMES